jgi:hypothetical protein
LVSIYGNERPLCKAHARMSALSFFETEASAELMAALKEKPK